MASFFIPIEVQPGVGLTVGEAYRYDDWGSDGRGGLGEVFHVLEFDLADALPDVDICLKRLKANFEFEYLAELLEEPYPGSSRAKLLDAIRTEYQMYVNLDGAQGHAPRAYALGAVVRGDDPEAAGSAQYAVLMDWIGGVGVMKLDLASKVLSGDSRGTGLSVEQTAQVGVKICEALWQVHRRNVTHRDLSPNNIMVRLSEGLDLVDRVVLIDFGQSTTPAEDETATLERRFASKPYGAPEMFAVGSDPYYDLRNAETVDIWSLGALLLFLRSGKHPSLGGWKDADGFHKLAMAKRDGITLPASCSSEGDVRLQDVIEACCRYNPNRRERLGAIEEALRQLMAADDAEVETPDVEAETPDVEGEVAVDSAPTLPLPDAPRQEWLDYLVRWDRYWNKRGRYSDDPYDADGYETDHTAECEFVEGMKLLFGYKGYSDQEDLGSGIYHLSSAIGTGSEQAVNCLVGYYNAFDVTRDEPPIPPFQCFTAEGHFVPARRVLRRIWGAYIRCLGRRTPDDDSTSAQASRLLVEGVRIVLGLSRSDRTGDDELFREYSAATACVKAAAKLGDKSASLWLRDGETFHIMANTMPNDRLFEYELADPDEVGALVKELDGWFFDDGQRSAFVEACGAKADEAVRQARQVLVGHEPAEKPEPPAAPQVDEQGLSDLELANRLCDTDPVRAFELYQRAAQAGDLGAMRELALCYYYGTGVERDLKTCTNLLRAASKAGNAFAEFSLLDLGLERCSAEELARLEDRGVSHTGEEEYRLGVQYELFGGGDPFYPYCRAAYAHHTEAKRALEARGEELPDRGAIGRRAVSGYEDAIREYEKLGGKLTSTMSSLLASARYQSAASSAPWRPAAAPSRASASARPTSARPTSAAPVARKIDEMRSDAAVGSKSYVVGDDGILAAQSDTEVPRQTDLLTRFTDHIERVNAESEEINSRIFQELSDSIVELFPWAEDTSSDDGEEWEDEPSVSLPPIYEMDDGEEWEVLGDGLVGSLPWDEDTSVADSEEWKDETTVAVPSFMDVTAGLERGTEAYYRALKDWAERYLEDLHADKPAAGSAGAAFSGRLFDDSEEARPSMPNLPENPEVELAPEESLLGRAKRWLSLLQDSARLSDDDL